MDYVALINREWPEWKIVSLLGNGSFGSVYLAEKNDGDTMLRSAIKTVCIPSYPIEDASYVSQQQKNDYSEIVGAFRSEIHTMELLKSAPNIVSIEDFKVVQQPNGVGWAILIRMEYLNSLDFSTMDESDVIKLGCDICTALAVCETNGIMHRDIKPSNILHSKHGGYKLGDFGISRMMEQDTVGASLTVGVGTPDFMAPEVAKNQPYDHRADIYSVGLVLYYALNEQRMPFLPSPTEKQILNMTERREAYLRRITEQHLPRPLHGSDALVAVIQKACAENPADRFSSAKEMKDELLVLLASFSNKSPLFSSNDKKRKKKSMMKRVKGDKKSKKKKSTLLITIISILFAGIFLATTIYYYDEYRSYEDMYYHGISIIDDLYDDLNSYEERNQSIENFFATGTSSFRPENYLVTVKLGESYTLPIYCLYDTTVSFTKSSDNLICNWSNIWDNGKTDVILSSYVEGSYSLNFTNQHNEDSFVVIIIVR